MNLTTEQTAWLREHLESIREMALDTIGQMRPGDDTSSSQLDLAMATLILGILGVASWPSTTRS